ncbi:BBE domain-containing protein [Candidatus Bathyarchaeota archaeon]|nr:BBE domain-containing protein [Candidatus Bathyarchaeota archaeon]
MDYWYGTAKTVKRNWYHHIDFHGGKNSALSAVDADATSYAHRDKLLLHNLYDRVDIFDEYPEDGLGLLNGFIDAIVGDGDRLDYGMYFNYPDPEMDQETAQERYWGSALPRLQEIKAAVDPDEVFWLPQSVKPAGGSVEAPEEPGAEPEEPTESVVAPEEPTESGVLEEGPTGTVEPAEPVETEMPE